MLILPHHIVAGPSPIAAPLRPAAGRRAALLVPQVVVAGGIYLADLLDLAAMPPSAMGGVAGSALDRADAVTDPLDAIFRDHPVGLPRP